MVNTPRALYKPAPASYLLSQFFSSLDSRKTVAPAAPQGPHHGHLLAGPVGLSFLPVRVPPAPYPAASAHPNGHQGKDLGFWAHRSSKRAGEGLFGPGLGMLKTNITY